MDITYTYLKRRNTFGHQPMFCEEGPVMCDSIVVDPRLHQHYILRNPVHQNIQHCPKFSKNRVNTYRVEFTCAGANHVEGGWPRDVNLSDPDAAPRYRRKIEKDDAYISCVTTVAPELTHCIQQNNAVDLYNIYYKEMEQVAPKDRSSCRTVNVYRDLGPEQCKRRVGSIAWQPNDGSRFLTTYANVGYVRDTRVPTTAYLWHIDCSSTPEFNITSPQAIVDLKFNPRECNVLVGGMIDGSVCVWDTRASSDPVNGCPQHVAHRDLVRSVLFIHSKSGQEFFSGGADGVCMWWDLRSLQEPTDAMIIDVVKTPAEVQSIAKSNGVYTLEYEPSIPTRFMVGTENGYVISGNRKGKTAMEQLSSQMRAHDGPVLAVERNPQFLKNFLTVGDWTARIWSEECRESAVLWSPPQRHKITAGAWSPTRLSLVLLTHGNGALTLWDLIRKVHEPVLSVQVCREPLLALQTHPEGALVACGSDAGDVYLVELSHSLTQSDKQDKGLITVMLDSETKRERILEARQREIRLKQRQAAEGTPEPSLTDLDPLVGDGDLFDATTEYFNAVKKESMAIL